MSSPSTALIGPQYVCDGRFEISEGARPRLGLMAYRRSLSDTTRGNEALILELVFCGTKQKINVCCGAAARRGSCALIGPPCVPLEDAL